MNHVAIQVRDISKRGIHEDEPACKDRRLSRSDRQLLVYVRYPDRGAYSKFFDLSKRIESLKFYQDARARGLESDLPRR